MKQELPIAVCLLALGGWLCFSLGQANSNEVGHSSANAAGPNVEHPGANFQNSNAAITSPTVSNIPPNDDGTIEQASPFGRMYPAESWLSVSGNAQSKTCKQQLRSIGAALSNSPSLATRTAIDCQILGIRLTAFGKYFRDGTNDRTRMELTFDDATSPHSVLQISDRNYVYTLRSDSKKPRLEFIDLTRLENKDAFLSTSALPTSWVVGGGMGESLRHYADAFDLREEPSEDSALIVMRGIWDPSTLINLVHSDLPLAQRPDKVIWSDMPAHIPHTVEFVFSKHPSGLIQPKRIAFFKFENVSDRAVVKEVLQMRFESMLLDRTLADGLFKIEANGFEATDMTAAYNQKIRQMTAGQPKIANELPAANLQVR